ncbi:MAG: 4-alpha-glucanotransferase [Bacteroidota bacterium]
MKCPVPPSALRSFRARHSPLTSPPAPMSLPRSSGLLLHITSLPGRYGIGDFGPAAYAFADFLAEAGQRVWQVLPLVPPGYGASPYASPSTFALNPYLVSPDKLRDAGLLTDDDLADVPAFPDDHVDFGPVEHYKWDLLRRAHTHFLDGAGLPGYTADDLATFEALHADWLPEYALFAALKEAHGGVAWTDWEPACVRRDPDALAQARETHADAIRLHTFAQFVADAQWQALWSYCRQRSIRLLGDLPIYVAHDSADVWANQDLFLLNDDGQPTVVAGVPPDYFSETGQRWGNPIYRWDRMKRNGYGWWVQRMARAIKLMDLVRLDHFRGFEAYWQSPGDEDTAVNGEWIEGPGSDLFAMFEKQFGAPLPIIAEDLGIITPGVRAIMAEFDFPGMVVLQFGYDEGPNSEHLPHNYRRDHVAYTGTHDNDTIQGWNNNPEVTVAEAEAKRIRDFACAYLGLPSTDHLHWASIRAVLTSVANLAVFPVQDLLGLGSETRINRPGSLGGINWAWRLEEGALTEALAEQLHRMTAVTNRLEGMTALKKVGE